jgi:hypothetical protein
MAPQRPGIGVLLLVGLVSGLMATLATLTAQAFAAPPALKLATVDVAGLVAAEVARLKDAGMEPAKAEAYAALWGPLLDQALRDVAEEEALVLLVSPSVVAGAPDLTGVLRERLQHDVARFQ